MYSKKQQLLYFRQKSYMERQEETHQDDWRNKLAHGRLSAEEAKTLQDDPEFREWKLLLDSGRALKSPAYSEHDAWVEFKQRLREPEQQLARLRRQRRTIFTISVLVLLVSVVAIWWYQGRDRIYTTPAGQTDRFVLPDNTQVQLNVASTLTWDPDRWASSSGRVVAFSGQAYFQRKNRSPFTLVHSNGQILTNRAAFDLRSRGQWLEIQCYQGRIIAKVQERTDTVLAGQYARWDGSRWTKRLIPNSRQEPIWPEGITEMRQMPLGEVTDELERLYQLSIDLNASPDTLFTGRFPNYDLDQALRTICDRMNLRPAFYPNNFVVLDPVPPEPEDGQPVAN